jgi:hypothetical protein
MTAVQFTGALFAGTAAVALWLFLRFPSAAPSSVAMRTAAAIAASIALQRIPVDASDRLHLYVSVFALMFPALVVTWITGLWLLAALRDVATR